MPHWEMAGVFMLAWNMLLAGVVFVTMGILAILGFLWNVRHGVSGYAAKIRTFYDQIGNRHASDERGIWLLAITKLAGILALGIVMLFGGVLFIALAATTN